jgi:hypothetical protein
MTPVQRRKTVGGFSSSPTHTIEFGVPTTSEAGADAGARDFANPFGNQRDGLDGWRKIRSEKLSTSSV